MLAKANSKLSYPQKLLCFYRDSSGFLVSIFINLFYLMHPPNSVHSQYDRENLLWITDTDKIGFGYNYHNDTNLAKIINI